MRQVKDYLEFSAAYFKQVTGTGPFTADQVTNAVTPTAPSGTPDYNYDIIGGLDAPLTYEIDIAQPVGSRITAWYAGAPVDPPASSSIAVNNYRQSGGGNFPHVRTAPVVYNRAGRDPPADDRLGHRHQTIDPAQFATVDWRLVSNGQPVVITG